VRPLAHQVHPQAEFLLGGGYLEVYLVVLDRLLMATTKKGQHFGGKKCTPRQNPGYVYVRLVPTSVSSNDLERRKNSPYFALFRRIR